MTRVILLVLVASVVSCIASKAKESKRVPNESDWQRWCREVKNVYEPRDKGGHHIDMDCEGIEFLYEGEWYAHITPEQGDWFEHKLVWEERGREMVKLLREGYTIIVKDMEVVRKYK